MKIIIKHRKLIIIGGDLMHWLIRPAIGWGAWLLLHSVAIPAVYALGKSCGKKECPRKKQHTSQMEAIETAE